MTPSNRNAFCASLIYGLLSIVWLALSDYALPRLIEDAAQLARWQHACGYAWVAVSAVVVFAARARLLELMSTGAPPPRREDDLQRLRLAAAVFDSTLEGVLVTDPRGKIVHVNRAFMAITGYQVEEVLNLNPSLFKSGRHGPDFYQKMYKTLMAVGNWSGEIWNRRKSGEIYPQWQTIRAIRDDKGGITHFVAVFSDMSSIKHSERELAHLAHYDPLTDLPNRLLLIDRVEQALQHARRTKMGCALLVMDLDHFKHINDSLGHNDGDQLLKAVAGRLGELLDKGTTLARLGGDEFAVLMENNSQVLSAAALAKQMVERMKQPFEIGGQPLFVSASVGVSLFPNDASNAEQLLRNADAALFKAKNEGRGRYALYTEELTAHARQRIELDSELRRALECDEFQVYYQPIHDLASRRVTGLEALVRWHHPVRGMVSPGDFIPVAEQNGLIAQIDAWVMDQSCRQMRVWLEAGIELQFVAVNVSSRLFGRGDLDQQVRRVLQNTGLDPRYLELEVTESAVMDDPEQAIEQLYRLRDLGVRLSIDDFGTGYSSLLRLKRMPVHKLKIDQGFVAGLPDDGDDVAIVRAIIALAHSLGLRVLAEGVEQEEQARFLLDNHCEYAQGYWFSRPVPPERIDWGCSTLALP